MGSDHRPHFRTTSTGHSNAPTTTNELFICFASRLSSSSSMKLTKSILSPGRAARDGVAAAGPVSLSSSLSRRLRSNGSLKGGASPFITTTTTTGRRRGGGFENPEPSSPKVTCIGQVRVKTKKKVKQTRSPSKRRSGEISFRKTEQQSTADNNGGDTDKDRISSQQAQIRYPNASGARYHHHQQQHAPECLPHRNQRWVHLPISICEALREFSCLFPCKSSCFSRDKAEDKQNGSDGNGCGSVCARWLVSVNDGEGGKRREIELVIGGGDEEEAAAAAERISMRSSRRHVFEDIEVKDDRIEIKGQSLEGAEEKARVSICIPPKNALLLMRCRSDPMKMASLANRFSWDAQGVCENASENVEEENNGVSGEQEEVSGCEGENEAFEQKVDVFVGNNEQQEISDQGNLEIMEVGELGNVEENKVDELLVISSEEMVEDNEKEDLQQEIVINKENLVEKDEEEEVGSIMSSFEALLVQENAEHYEDAPIQDGEEEEVKDSPSICHLSPSPEPDAESNEVPLTTFLEDEALMGRENEETEEESNTNAEKDPTRKTGSEEKRAAAAKVKPDPETPQQEDEEEMEDGDLNFSEMEKSENQEGQSLPECLLLMMCEPKLSMEVSKETWVCSTDFIRWLPERPRKAETATMAAKATGGGCDHEPVTRRLSTDPKPNKPPATASMATMIEQKLVNAVGYEPFVLSRCKSEPMRTAAAKLMPESCFWKNAARKMEPHRRAALGVGAAGVGF